MADEIAAPKKEKDFWDKLQIVIQPVNGLLTALTIALLGYYTSSVLRDREVTQANKSVYTELTASREQAESSLRKDMFTSIIDTFFRPGSANDPEARMLNLELLAYNFHESLNLKPLFSYMLRQISSSNGNPAMKKEYTSRLQQVANEIKT